MPGMGPPPKDPSRRARRNAPTINTTVLPGAGRSGPTPKWPFPPDQQAAAQLQAARAKVKNLRALIAEDGAPADVKKLEQELETAEIAANTQARMIRQRAAREKALWTQLWKTPQAVMWERLYAHRAVAAYVQTQISGELGNSSSLKEARLRETDLGLNPKGMQNLRWSVSVDEVTEKRTETRSRKAAPLPPPATSSRNRRGPLRIVEQPKAAAGDA